MRAKHTPVTSPPGRRAKPTSPAAARGTPSGLPLSRKTAQFGLTILAAFAILLAPAMAAANDRASTTRTRTLRATLNSKNVPSGVQVVRPVLGTFVATGSFTCQTGQRNCNTEPGPIHWTITFAHASDPEVKVGIWLGKSGEFGALAIQLCTLCKSGQHGTTSITRKVFEAIKAGRAFVNLTTPLNYLGESRGEIHLTSTSH